MGSSSMPMYSVSSIAILISSAVMQSGMSLHHFIALVVVYMPGFSSSLFVSTFCLDNQSVMNNYDLALYCTSCFIGLFLIISFKACVKGLQHLS